MRPEQPDTLIERNVHKAWEMSSTESLRTRNLATQQHGGASRIHR
jgi:hypothetical protein